MKEWKPHLYDISENSMLGNSIRDYDIYLNFVDVLNLLKIQQEPIKISRFNLDRIRKLIKEDFMDDFTNKVTEKILTKDKFWDYEFYQICYYPMTRTFIIEPYYEIKNKEENDMLKILEIYKEKQKKLIEDEYENKKKEWEENDPVLIYIKQAEETLKEMLNINELKIGITSSENTFTKETQEKIFEIMKIKRTKLRNLEEKIKEIESLLELAPNYEEKIKILRDYEIIDKKKNIIL